MLENLRRQGASIFIYLIFGLLIAIFVINIGPGSGKRGDGGCSGRSNTIISVDGYDSTQTAYHVAYSGQNYIYQQPPSGRNRVYLALEALIQRELLANAAEERGIRVTTDAIQDEIKKGYFFYAGHRINLGHMVFDEHDDAEHTKTWNYAKYKRFVSDLNVSLESYQDEQARSMEAALMSELIQNSVNVSRDEALGEYLFNNTTVQYDVVAFRPDQYKSAMRLTDADLERYVAGHEQEVKDRYKADERLYNDKNRKPDLKLRQIFIAKLEPEAKPEDKKPEDKKPEDKKAADKKPDTKAGAPEKKKVGMPIDAAKAKLEATRAAIASGKQKFAEAAKELSSADAMKASGGELGWKPADNPGFDDKAVNDAVKALKPGEMTPVIATDAGVYLVMAEAKREGALTYDQVKLEIARGLALDTWSKEAARRAALDALAKATAGTGKNLDQLFKRKIAPPQITPDMQQMIEQQLQQQTGGGDEGPSGSIVYESKDIPAAWKADADGSSGGTSTGSAPAPKTPAAGSATTPAAGSATTPAAGSAAPAAGSAAAPAPPAKPAAPDLMTPSKDVLPAFGEIEAPMVQKFGPVSRIGYLPGIGKSKEITTTLFDELGPNQIAKKIYEVEGVYYVVQAAGKSQPKVEDFDKQSAMLIEGLRLRRGSAAVTEWLKNRCEALAKANKITPAPEMIHESDDQGKPLPIVYHPCMTFH